MSYNNYLNSEHWQDKRKEKLTSNTNCEICNSIESLHIHHGRYTIDEKTAVFDSITRKIDRRSGSILGQEILDELFVFCASCHKLWHRYYGYDFPRRKIIRKIKCLLEKGAIKNKAFWVASQPELYAKIIHKDIHKFKAGGGDY